MISILPFWVYYNRFRYFFYLSSEDWTSISLCLVLTEGLSLYRIELAFSDIDVAEQWYGNKKRDISYTNSIEIIVSSILFHQVLWRWPLQPSYHYALETKTLFFRFHIHLAQRLPPSRLLYSTSTRPTLSHRGLCACHKLGWARHALRPNKSTSIAIKVHVLGRVVCSGRQSAFHVLCEPAFTIVLFLVVVSSVWNCNSTRNRRAECKKLRVIRKSKRRGASRVVCVEIDLDDLRGAVKARG